MECNGAKVFIDVEEYDKLREFKRNIENGNVYRVDRNHFDDAHIEYYLEKDQAIEDLKCLLSQELEVEKSRYNKKIKKCNKEQELYVDKISRMDIWEFKKWRKEYVNK